MPTYGEACIEGEVGGCLTWIRRIRARSPNHRWSPGPNRCRSPGPNRRWNLGPNPSRMDRCLPCRKAIAAVVAALLLLSAGVGLGWAFSRHGPTVRSTGKVPIHVVPQVSPSNSSPGAALNLQAIATLVNPAIVDINTVVDAIGGQVGSKAAGTGMVLTSTGEVVTNNHVIAGATSITVTVQGSGSYSATVIGVDPVDDVALIQVQGVSGLATVTLASDTVVEVFPLRNRPAQDLLPAIRAVVGNEGVVEALDTRLVVRATPAALARIRAALPALDVAPRTLSVTVSQRRDAETSARAGSARIETGRAPSTGGGNGETRTRTVVTGAFSASSSSAEGEDVQQMRVLEGHPAFIQVGRSVPVAVTGTVETPGGPVPARGTAFAESGSGFYVLARGAGDGIGDRLPRFVSIAARCPWPEGPHYRRCPPWGMDRGWQRAARSRAAPGRSLAHAGRRTRGAPGPRPCRLGSLRKHRRAGPRVGGRGWPCPWTARDVR